MEAMQPQVNITYTSRRAWTCRLGKSGLSWGCVMPRGSAVMATPSLQQPLPPMLLPKHSPDEPVRTICERDVVDGTAAQLFAEALDAAGLTTKDVAMLLGVSDSLVNRMRSPNYRERVSFAQLLLLPPDFHIALHRAMNKRFGFGKAALLQVIEGLGVLAVGLE